MRGLTRAWATVVALAVVSLWLTAPPGTVAEVSEGAPVVWDLPWPDASLPHQGYPLLGGVEHAEVYHAIPETGMFSHHPHITATGGALLACWSNHALDEDASG